MKSITTHFDELGAPLKNARWSWGAMRRADNTLFLRVWEDEQVTIDGQVCYMVLRELPRYAGPGRAERELHLQAVRRGVFTLLVVCIAAGTRDDGKPRRIRTFNDHLVAVGGKLIEYEGDLYITTTGQARVTDQLVRGAA